MPGEEARGEVAVDVGLERVLQPQAAVEQPLRVAGVDLLDLPRAPLLALPLHDHHRQQVQHRRQQDAENKDFDGEKNASLTCLKCL